MNSKQKRIKKWKQKIERVKHFCPRAIIRVYNKREVVVFIDNIMIFDKRTDFPSEKLLAKVMLLA